MSDDDGKAALLRDSAQIIESGDVRLNGVVPTSVGAESSGRVSASLQQMIAAADRRLFPHHPNLALDFSHPDELAIDLVPDEVLYLESISDQPISVADPLDLTPSDSLDLRAISNADGILAEPRDSSDASESRSESGEINLSSAEVGRQVTTVDAERLVQDSGPWNQSTFRKLAWELDVHPGNFKLEVRPKATPGGAEPHVQVLIVMRGTIELEPVVDLATERRSPLERLRSVELARASLRDQIGILAQTEGTFWLSPLSISPDPPLAASPGKRAPIRIGLLVLVVEILRQQVSSAMAVSACGQGSIEVVLTSSIRSRLIHSGVEPEVLSLFTHDAISVTTLLEDVPAKYGLAGLLVLLQTLGFVRKLTAIETNSTLDAKHRLERPTIRARVQQMAGRARKGSYFEMLELEDDATARQISFSSERLLEELEGLMPDCEFSDLRNQAIEGVREAAAVLSNSRFRDLYRAGRESYTNEP